MRAKKTVNITRSPIPETGWNEVRGRLDEAIDALPGKQREAVIWHYLAGRSLGEMSSETGIVTATLQSRVKAGLENLRSILSAGNLAVTVAGLGTMLAGNAVDAAPAGLEQKLFTAIANNISAGGSAAGGMVNMAIKEIEKMMFMAKLKIAAGIVAAAAIVAGTGGAFLAAQNGKPEIITATTAPSAPGNATVVEITDKVILDGVTRLGINMETDTYSRGKHKVKKRIQENFEGTSYRQCHFGPAQEEEGAFTWYNISDEWKKKLVGGKFTIISGPAKGSSGTVKDVVRKKTWDGRQEVELSYIVFDKKVPAGPMNTGVLVENLLLNEGNMDKREYFSSKQNEISINDVPPGSFGCAALNMKGASGPSLYRFGTMTQKYAQMNGTWHVDFWAKAKEGDPKLNLTITNCAKPPDVTLEKEWKKYELTATVANIADENTIMFVVFNVTGGDMLLDDVVIWMDEGDKNPTVFRDETVAALKKFNPGVIRSLQMGGNTIDNVLSTKLRSYAYRSSAEIWSRVFSLPELYELCEYLGAEPWYCLPGTLHLEEMRNFMEYIGGPADSKYGKLRVQHGHPKPWTETLPAIHIAFGNEAWNNSSYYRAGGYDGPDYWKDLIDEGKKSKYYAKNVIFHAAGWANNVNRNLTIMKNAPNADRLAIGPYLMVSMSKAHVDLCDTDDKLFRWVMAEPIRRSRIPEGVMTQNFQNVQKAGMELSFYEVNYHITGGDAPLEARNRIVTSAGGAVGLLNDMLLMMKEEKARKQCVFCFIHPSFRADSGEVKLWGTCLNLRKGKERYRPTFLGCEIANRIIAGDMLETVHSGADPKFSATGIFQDKPQVQTYDNVPTVWSYAFSKDNRRSLILFNLDVSQPLPVIVRFAGQPKDGAATTWLLTADKITANNEYETGEPQVSTKEDAIKDFASGRKIVLPPFSMIGLSWENK
ncbi:MAG: hypothetical protein HZA50_05610 [Planctomycetes bacterium]|nr:hypothetical protein [Planctomycetota bacterium]